MTQGRSAVRGLSSFKTIDPVPMIADPTISNDHLFRLESFEVSPRRPAGATGGAYEAWSVQKPRGRAGEPDMITQTDQKTDAVARMAALAESQAGDPPRWLATQRQAGLARFTELGFPTTRVEDWRFTSVERIVRTPFDLPGAQAVEPAAAALEPFIPPDLNAATLVFVNGRYAPGLSSVAAMPDRVRVVPLAEAIAAGDELVRTHLADGVTLADDAFAALNTAFIGDGVLIHVPARQCVQTPIHVLNVAAPGREPIMTHPRNLIVCDEGSEATVIEHYVALGEGVVLNNAVTQIEVGANANVSHYLIEQENSQSFNVSSLFIHQHGHSSAASHTVLFGGALVRNNVHPVLDGERCECLINGLFVGDGEQHLDNFMRVEHAAPHGDSRQFYKGILSDKAHGVFSGRIYVAQVAQKTDAKQTNANLLLSDTAQIDTKPQLEIYADDVKCTHGATIGQLDEDAVFYLRSRGIHENAARAMVMYAFAAESFERMQLEPLRTWLGRELLAKLPEGAFLQSIV